MITDDVRYSEEDASVNFITGTLLNTIPNCGALTTTSSSTCPATPAAIGPAGCAT